jgi:hypothetical protein
MAESDPISDLRRERFLRVYTNLPIAVRKEIVLVLEDEKGVKQPVSWEAAYLEIRDNLPLSQRMLDILEKLKVI